MMFAYSERETDECYEQKNNEKRQQDGIADQEAESDRA